MKIPEALSERNFAEMLDQLRRLVSSSGDGAHPNESARNSGRNSGRLYPGVLARTNGGSLGRQAIYSVPSLPATHARLRTQQSAYPNPSAGSAVPVVAYGHYAAIPVVYRHPVVAYDQWLRYGQQPKLSRQRSAHPDVPDVAAIAKKRSQHPFPAESTTQRLASSRSLDSITPHRIEQHPAKDGPQVKSSASKVKNFFQRIKVSVGGGGGSAERKPEMTSAEWLLHRPSPTKSVKNPSPRHPTPRMTALRRIFTRSPSPIPAVKSGSLSSDPSHKDRSLRGDPDGATFPRDCPANPPESPRAITSVPLPATPSPLPVIPATPSPLPIIPATPPKRKFAKKVDPVFRVRRRQSQVRRSGRLRRSRRSGRKKRSSQKKNETPSQQSGAKLVSDWTYLPLPTSLHNPEAAEESSSADADADGWESDLYQVLVERAPRRHPPPPMWDPLIFVPPERRRNSGNGAPIQPNASGRIDAQNSQRNSQFQYLSQYYPESMQNDRF